MKKENRLAILFICILMMFLFTCSGQEKAEGYPYIDYKGPRWLVMCNSEGVAMDSLVLFQFNAFIDQEIGKFKVPVGDYKVLVKKMNGALLETIYFTNRSGRAEGTRPSSSCDYEEF